MESRDSEILLGAYAADRCPRRVHNDFDRTIQLPSEPFIVSATAQERIEAGRDFEAQIKALLISLHGSDVLDIGPQISSETAIRATAAAMSRGVRIILGGWLPNDVQGGRKGRPDVLLRCAGAGPDWRYAPVDIKGHKTLSASNKSDGDALLSVLARPYLADAEADGARNQRRNRRDKDTMQLAHYWRMLQACQRAPQGPAIAGIIGTDHVDAGVAAEVGVEVLADVTHVVSWFDLDRPIFRTFSRSDPGGTATRSALERYDHEMTFRLAVAQQAAQRVGAATDPDPLVEPIWVAECQQCPWQNYCATELGPDNASFAVGRLDAQSWVALSDLGIAHVDDLAALEPTVIEEFDAETTSDDSWTRQVVSQYVPHVAHQRNATRNLAKAVRTAQMVQAGVYLQRRTSGPIDVQRADIEVHLDVESDRSTRVYLWGMYIVDHAAGLSHYEDVSNWNPLDDHSEVTLTRQFWNRLVELIARAEQDDKTIRVYHYSTPEPNALRKAAKHGEGGDFAPRSEVEQVIKTYFDDLFRTVGKHFWGRNTLGLKDVARHGPGFQWRDEDPGGLQSQMWLDEVYGGNAVAKKRVLEYNEDDVRATDAVLGWLAGS
jgi:predicted RecB family nuclease